MKRIVLMAVIMAASILFCSDVSAQNRWGITGGVTTSSAKLKDLGNSTVTNFHAGLTYRFDLPFGLSFQPSLLYSVKGAKVSDLDFSMGYLELMPSVQWGPDLLLFRPFLDVSPFVGYGINTKVKADFSKDALQDSLNKLEYGVGVGFGLDVWRLQLIGRYNWNFGGIMAAHNGDGLFNDTVIKDALKGSDYAGFTLTAAILF